MSSSSRNHKLPGSQWCHALSLASCAIRCDNPRGLFPGTTEGEKGGAASAWLGDGGGAWDTAQVGRTGRIFDTALS